MVKTEVLEVEVRDHESCLLRFFGVSLGPCRPRLFSSQPSQSRIQELSPHLIQILRLVFNRRKVKLFIDVIFGIPTFNLYSVFGF